MKKIFIISLALLALSACQQSLTEPVDFDIQVSAEESTFYAGDPVTFNIKGNVDNLVFYSGEYGHQYIHKDRYSVPVEKVVKADLELKIWVNYGLPGGLDVFVSNTGIGLSGKDAAADRAAAKALEASGMEGWTKIAYEDPKTYPTTVKVQLPISEYMDNFCLAFHWKPENEFDKPLRTYSANGSISLDLGDAGKSDIDLSALDFVALQMDEKAPDPYNIPKGDARVILNYDENAIFFKGVRKGKVSWDPEAWVICQPRALNRVEPDKGEVIKNLQNTLESFTHVFEEPGEYELVFVGINGSVSGSSKKVITRKIVIIDRPVD